MPAPSPSHFTPFAWDDALRLDTALSEDERAIRDAAHDFCQEKLFPARADGQPAGKVRPRDHERIRRDGLPRRHAGRLRLRRRELCQLRPDLARGRAGRFRLPLGVLGAVVAGDVSDLRLRVRGAAAEIPAEAAHRRVRRLLRPDRTGCRLRSGLDAHPGEEGRWRLPAERLEDLDHQLADRRCAGGVGEGRCRRHPRLHPGTRHGRPDAAEDRGQVLAARLGHRHDHDAGRVRPGREPASRA